MSLNHESKRAAIAAQEIVSKALSKDPDSRIQSMGELRDALLDLADLITREREAADTKPGGAKHPVVSKGIVILILGILVITGSGLAVWRQVSSIKPVAEPPQSMPYVDAPKKDMYPGKSDDILGTWLEKYAPADNEMFQWSLSGVQNCDLEVEKAVRGGQIRRKVFVDFADLSDRGLELMKAWPLSALGLRLTEVTDAGLLEIGKFADLEYLSLIQPGSTVFPGYCLPAGRFPAQDRSSGRQLGGRCGDGCVEPFVIRAGGDAGGLPQPVCQGLSHAGLDEELEKDQDLSMP
ncbi:MAG: hypothetical protein IPM23_19590 [Candidatus Melainabacteria bacterium]|nr:hypothetical protein [Candidatus Melainabacteria bacterium]